MEYDEMLLMGFSNLKKAVGVGTQASGSGCDWCRKGAESLRLSSENTTLSTERWAWLHTCELTRGGVEEHFERFVVIMHGMTSWYEIGVGRPGERLLVVRRPMFRSRADTGFMYTQASTKFSRLNPMQAQDPLLHPSAISPLLARYDIGADRYADSERGQDQEGSSESASACWKDVLSWRI